FPEVRRHFRLLLRVRTVREYVPAWLAILRPTLTTLLVVCTTERQCDYSKSPVCRVPDLPHFPRASHLGEYLQINAVLHRREFLRYAPLTEGLFSSSLSWFSDAL